MEQYQTIDAYIAAYSGELQSILVSIRETIRSAAPDAAEKISWQMPTFWQGENLIHFAAAKKHIGIYPGPEAIEHFKHRLAEYKTSKGAIQMPLDRPIPYDLIAEITRFRVKAAETKHKKVHPI